MRRQNLRTLAARMEAAPWAAARSTVARVTDDADFERAFVAGDVRAWPVAVMSDAILDALPQELRGGRVVVDDVKKGKLAVKHPEVSVSEYRMLQNALDRGDVLLRRPPTRRNRLPSLIVLVPVSDERARYCLEMHGKQVHWWFWAIKLNPNRAHPGLATVFATGHRVRQSLLEAEDVTVLRAWHRSR